MRAERSQPFRKQRLRQQIARSLPESQRVWPVLPRGRWRERRPQVRRLGPESQPGRGSMDVQRRTSFDGLRVYGDAWKTPGTLVLGVGCQPIERENWLVAERVRSLQTAFENSLHSLISGR